MVCTQQLMEGEAPGRVEAIASAGPAGEQYTIQLEAYKRLSCGYAT